MTTGATSITTGWRRAVSTSVLLMLLLALSVPARAQQEVRLSVMATASGVVGGQAPFHLVLGNVLQTDVAGASADLRFDPEVLSLDVATCAIDADIAESHVLEASGGSGQAQIGVFPRAEPVVLPAGPLVSCSFAVAPTFSGTATAVTFDSARVVDPAGDDVPVITLDGVIIIPQGTRVPTPTQAMGPTFTVRSAKAPSACTLAATAPDKVLESWCSLAGALSLLVLRRMNRSGAPSK